MKNEPHRSASLLDTLPPSWIYVIGPRIVWGFAVVILLTAITGAFWMWRHWR